MLHLRAFVVAIIVVAAAGRPIRMSLWGGNSDFTTTTFGELLLLFNQSILLFAI